MYQKIEINNFGPVNHAEIELRPLVVLIGQQAGGKSTIAKLIYFFQLIPSEFFSRFYSSEREWMDMTQDLIVPIREKFYDFFGSTFHLPNFNNIFYYNETHSLTLSLTPNKRIDAHFSDGFFSTKDRNELRGFKKSILQYKSELIDVDNPAKKVMLDEQQANLLRQMANKIYEMFTTRFDDSLYILAGRNATVSYSETFEDLLKQSIRKKIEEQGGIAFKAKEQTIDESLMLDFMQRVLRIRQTFIKSGNFEGMITMSNSTNRGKLILANRLVQKVIRGQYANSEYGERIVLQNGNYVYLKNASSGQQEAIRILQDAFLSIYQGGRVMRIVEEPEAHLFPEAQMYTIQLLVLMLNSLPGSHLILTTHSPYTLTIINNLIYAAKVGQNNPEQVNQIMPKELWLPNTNVAAYMLHDGASIPAIDGILHEIKAELIDEVSNEINIQYESLMNFDTDGK